MSKLAAISTLVYFLLLPQTAWGVVLGNDFYEWCNNDEGNPFRFLCMGYILGVSNMKDMDMVISGNFIYCQPSMTNKQSRKVVIRYMDSHPEDLHLPALVIIQYAYKEYFPCNAQQLEEHKKMHEYIK